MVFVELRKEYYIDLLLLSIFLFECMAMILSSVYSPGRYGQPQTLCISGGFLFFIAILVSSV